MINQDIRDELPEEAIVFDNPAFDNSIIGYDETGCTVYDYDKMVEELMEEDGISEEDAIEFIEYNTIRAIPYAPNFPPIVIHRIGRWDI